MLIVTEELWIKSGLCREVDDPTIFFPPVTQKFTKRDLEIIDDAIAVCSHCPVRVQCNRYAEENSEVGIWAGKVRLFRSHPSR